jgi:hypothetical protein
MAAVIPTELKTLLQGSLLILKAIGNPNERRFLNPATAYEEAQRRVNEKRGAPQARNAGPKAPTP